MAEGLGEAVVTIGADMNPYMAALGSMGSKSLGPISTAMDTVAGFMSHSVANIGDIVGALMAKRMGDSFEAGGVFLTESISGTVSGVFATVMDTAGAIIEKGIQAIGVTVGIAAGLLTGGFGLILIPAFNAVGEAVHKTFTLLGETIGGTLEGIFNKITGMTLGVIGKLLNAVTGPIAEALSAPLTNLDKWVGKAIEADKSIAHMQATLEATGRTAAFSMAGINSFAQGIADTSEHSKGEVLKAMDQIFMMDKIRGKMVGRATEASAVLADIQGTGISEAAAILSRALQNPEQGAARLKKQLKGLIDDRTLEDIVRLGKAGDRVGAQAKLLEAIETKGKPFSDIMGGTVETKLAQLTSAWESMGKSAGQALLPVTRQLVEMSIFIVKTFSGPVNEVFKELKVAITGTMSVANGWVKENIGTFQKWRDLIAEIVRGGWNTLKTAVKELTGNIDAQAMTQFWTSFKDGVTSVLNTVLTLVSNWSLVKEGASLAAEYVKVAWMDAVKFIKNLFTWDEVVGELRVVWAGVIAFISTSWDQVTKTLALAWKGSGMEGLITGLKNEWKIFAEYVGSIWDAVLHGFLDMAQKMLDVAKKVGGPLAQAFAPAAQVHIDFARNAGNKGQEMMAAANKKFDEAKAEGNLAAQAAMEAAKEMLRNDNANRGRAQNEVAAAVAAAMKAEHDRLLDERKNKVFNDPEAQARHKELIDKQEAFLKRLEDAKNKAEVRRDDEFDAAVKKAKKEREDREFGKGDKDVEDLKGSTKKEAFAGLHDSIQAALKGDKAAEQRDKMIAQQVKQIEVLGRVFQVNERGARHLQHLPKMADALDALVKKKPPGAMFNP